MMSIALEGGVRHTLDGRAERALQLSHAVRGASGLPDVRGRAGGSSAIRATSREQNGFRFQIYTRGAVTLVFWQEGDLVCVLASELPAVEVVALAVAKAMAPA